MDETSAVRVEVDLSFDAGSPSANPTDPDSPDSSGRVVALGAACVLAAVFVVALILLRPSAGETAVGTERQATTTTTTTTVEVTTTVASAAPIVRERDGEVSGREPNLNEVVRDEIGFFGLGFGDSAGGLELYRSLRGVDWTRIEVGLTERALPRPSTWTRFSNLVATEDGLAVLRIEEQFAITTTFDRPTTIERLVSADGIEWDIDGDAEPINIGLGDTWFTFQTGDTFGVNTGVASAPFGQFLEGLLTEDAGIDPTNVCWMDLVGLNQIRTFPCEGGTAAADFATGNDITESDFVEPARFDDLVACVGVLFDFAFASGEFTSTVQRSNGLASTYSSTVDSFQHTPLTDGSIVALSYGDLFLPPAQACDSFNGGLPEVGSPAIELLQLDGDIRQFPIPQEVSELSRDAWATLPSFQESDEGLLVLLANSAWVLDLSSGDWRKAADLPTDFGRFFDFRFTSDARVVGISEDGIAIIDLDTGITDVHELEGELGRFGFIEYIDNEVVLVKVDDEVVPIELPPK